MSQAEIAGPDRAGEDADEDDEREQHDERAGRTS